MTALELLAESLRRRSDARAADLPARLERLAACIREAKSQLRALSRGLVPVEVEAGGLLLALEELTQEVRETCAVDCRFECDGSVPVRDGFSATQLYRIAQEAVHNALQHGRPGRILVRLEERGRELRLTIRDDGQGIAAGAGDGRGRGLRIMRHRAGIIGAELDVEPAADGGTLVRCALRSQGETATCSTRLFQA